MIYPVYCIKDNKVGFQPQLLLESNEPAAVRGFSYAVNNNGIMNFSPKDYDLYKIGKFDSDSGKLEYEVPTLIISGSSVFGVNE